MFEHFLYIFSVSHPLGSFIAFVVPKILFKLHLTCPCCCVFGYLLFRFSSHIGSVISHLHFLKRSGNKFFFKTFVSHFCFPPCFGLAVTHTYVFASFFLTAALFQARRKARLVILFLPSMLDCCSPVFTIVLCMWQTSLSVNS